MADIGESMANGVWNGIRSMAGSVTSKIRGFFEDIVDDVKDSLDIASPSKVFAGIGENMGLGIGVGFDEAMGRVSRAMENAIPTNFDIQPYIDMDTSGIKGFSGTTGQPPAYGQHGGGVPIIIQHMEVRSDDDIRQISQRLYNLMQGGNRANGSVALA
jgi:hypothetical protein